MNRVFKVAVRELKERGRSRTFIFSTVITAVLLAGLIIIPGLVGGGPQEYGLGSLGDGNTPIIDAAERIAVTEDEPGEEPTVITITEFQTRAEAESAVDAGEVDAVLVDGEEVIVRSVGLAGSPLLSLLGQAAAAVELEELISEEGDTAVRVIEVLTTDSLTVSTLSGDDGANRSAVAVAYGGLMLLYIAILLYGTWILTGVTEEKSNRVVEVLLSTLRPSQLLAGKILGIGLLGITQFTFAGAVVLFAIQFTDVDLPNLGAATVANLVLWFVIGFLIYAFMFGAAGSRASRMEDAQNVAFPMTTIAVIGLFVAFQALDNPTGPVALVGTFVPLTAPFVVPVRIALNAIPLWHVLSAIAISLVAVASLAVVAGRIYAGSLLKYGGTVKVREAWRSARE